MLKPPSPCTGSMMMAAMLEGSAVCLNSDLRLCRLCSLLTAVVGVGELNVVDVGGEGAEALLVGHDLAGQRHAHVRAAVEAAG